MKKTVTIDGYKYEVTVRHEPSVFFPFRYEITVSHKGELLNSAMLNNSGSFPLVQLVENTVKDTHTSLMNEQKRIEAKKKFEKEFKEWDGVIEV